MKIATVSYNDKTAAKDLTDSLHYTGFAVLSHHPIEPRLIDDVYEEWRQFFKNEPLLYKIIYLIGVIFLFVNLNDITSGKNEVNIAFPIIAFGILIFLFMRLAVFSNNNDY